MSRIRIQVTPGFARSARELGKMLEIDVLKNEGSTYRPQAGDLIINYGSATLRWRDPGIVWMNHPHKVREKTDKRDQLRRLASASVRVPTFTADRETAKGMVREFGGVFARVNPESHGGNGILYVQGSDRMPDAPLYTADIGVVNEYRVHVMNDAVIGVRQKLRKNEFPEHKVRSYANGYFYSVHEPRNSLPVLAPSLAREAVDTLGLEFGGVDIGVDAHGIPYVFEVNAAPGLDGPDFDNYANAIRTWIAEKGAA